MSDSKQRSVRLGRLEAEIMNVVWERTKATVREVSDALPRKRAYSTVLTMMRNLEAKGYLSHKVRDRTYVYRAEIERSLARSSILAELIERLFDGSPSLLVTSLVEDDLVDEEELEKIQRLIEKGTER